MKTIAILALSVFAPLPALAQHEGHDMQDHSMHATTPAPTAPAGDSPFPEPTATQRAAAFPDLGGMDMSAHMQEDPWVAALRVEQLEWSSDDALGTNLRASFGRSFDKLLVRTEAERPQRGQVMEMRNCSGATRRPLVGRVMGVRSDFGDGRTRQCGRGRHWLAPYSSKSKPPGISVLRAPCRQA